MCFEPYEDLEFAWATKGETVSQYIGLLNGLSDLFSGDTTVMYHKPFEKGH